MPQQSIFHAFIPSNNSAKADKNNPESITYGQVFGGEPEMV